MADEYARLIASMAIAHVANIAGCTSVQKSSLNALVDIMEKYIRTIGTDAKNTAELAGRTKPCLVDFVCALRELSPTSTTLAEILATLPTATPPFPRDVPSFPQRRVQEGEENLVIGKREPLPEHVPSFLPPLPSHHTYGQTKRDAVTRETRDKNIRLELLTQTRQIQQSLNRLHERSHVQDDTTEMNPFLLPAKREGPRCFQPLPSAKKTRLTASAGGGSESKEEQTKEDRMIDGTFYEGDSE